MYVDDWQNTGDSRPQTERSLFYDCKSRFSHFASLSRVIGAAEGNFLIGEPGKSIAEEQKGPSTFSKEIPILFELAK